MTDKPFHVYVIQGRGEMDYSDCQAALTRVPATMTALPFLGTEDEVIARTRDADALVVSFSPVTRGVMGALEGLKTVVRTGVGYDVIDVPAATELGVIVVNIPDLWVREVANHALALLLAWNRQIVTSDRQVHAGVWSGRVPGDRTGSLHGETVGIVGLGNIGSAFARRVAAFETKVIASDPYVDVLPPHEADGHPDQHLTRSGGRRGGAGPCAPRQAPGGRGAGCVGAGAGRRRQPPLDDGQRHRHAPRRLFLVGRGGPGAAAVRRGDRAGPHRAAAAQRGEPGGVRVRRGAPELRATASRRRT